MKNRMKVTLTSHRILKTKSVAILTVIDGDVFDMVSKYAVRHNSSFDHEQNGTQVTVTFKYGLHPEALAEFLGKYQIGI